MRNQPRILFVVSVLLFCLLLLPAAGALGQAQATGPADAPQVAQAQSCAGVAQATNSTRVYIIGYDWEQGVRPVKSTINLDANIPANAYVTSVRLSVVIRVMNPEALYVGLNHGDQGWTLQPGLTCSWEENPVPDIVGTYELESEFAGGAATGPWELFVADTGMCWGGWGHIESWSIEVHYDCPTLGGDYFVAQGNVRAMGDQPLQNVTVRLYGRNEGTGSNLFIGSVVTDADGAFSLGTNDHYETYTVREIDPPGYFSSHAQPGDGGETIDSNTVQFSGLHGLRRSTVFYDYPVTPTPTQKPALVLIQGVNGYTGTKDTFIDEYEPNRHDCNGSIYIRNNYAWGSLLRFELAPSIPTGAHITSAYLRLYTEMRSNTLPLSLGVWRLKRDWSECDATWIKATATENWGSYGCKSALTDRDASPAATVPVPAQTDRGLQVDITSLVQGWVDNPATNHGMYLGAIADVSTAAGFSSSNNAYQERRPALIIRWEAEEATATPTPLSTPTMTPTPAATLTPTPTATPTTQPGGARLAVSPASKSVALAGGNTTIDIVARQASNWGAYQLELTFDPAVVRVVSVTRGPFLGSTGRTVIPVTETYDNAAGRLTMAAITAGTQGGASGDGVVASVTFQPVAAGNSALHLENAQISTPAGGALTVGLDHGQITVTSCFADFDGDGDVDILDLQTAAGHWNCHTGQSCYEARFDADGDGDVDIMDLQQFAAAWGAPCNTSGAPSARAAALAMDGANLGLLPPSAPVAVGDVFTVTLHVDGASSVGAYQADLVFDPTILSVQAVTPGGFLASTGRSVSPAGPDIDNQTGRVTFGAFSFGAQAGASGEGDLAQVRFLALAAGQSGLSLQNVQLSDPQGQPQPLGNVAGGSVVVGQAPQHQLHLPIVLRLP